MLTSKITQELPLPHEPGAVITVRLLSGEQLKRARQARAREALKAYGELSASVDLSTLPSQAQDSAAVLEADPLASYDVGTLLAAGIVAWTYEEPVTPETIADLDEVTMDYVARALLPPARSEGERGEGSAVSTTTSKATAPRPTNG